LKTAIVTGGSSGIGLGIIKNLKSQGIQAVSWDIHAPKEGGSFIHCDVTSEHAVRLAVKETVESFGAPTILINGCGLQFMSPIDEFPLEKWNHLISVMLTGTFLCSKHVIPFMKAAGWGRIINISSMLGKGASPFKCAYVAAKHGVLGLSKVMALELAGDGVTVNSICPGFVDTPLMREQMARQAELNNISEDQVAQEIMLKPACIKKFTTVNQVAGMVDYFLSDAASNITGEAFSISGGWGMGQ